MPETRSIMRRFAARHFLILTLLSSLGLCALFLLAGQAHAVPYTGGFAPRIIGEKADLNGNLVVNGRDDANAFYGETSIIDGMLDCDAWTTPNDGAAGSGAITTGDNCELVGVDGTLNGVTIEVVSGRFQVANGLLPTVFNASNPVNPGVAASDFAWSTINGRVDSNGDEDIGGDDCHFGLIGRTVDSGLGDATDGADVLGDDPLCGFASPPGSADNGLVDLNSDEQITAADSCSNSCFFGHDLRFGIVQAECPGFAGNPANDVVGTNGGDVLTGTARADIICGRGGNDILVGLGGNDLLVGGTGADVLRGRRGRDVLRGGSGGDRLLGGRGGDRLFGNRGRDDLRGGAGFDSCFGGPNLDTFVSCGVAQQ